MPSYVLRADAPGGLGYYWHQTTEEEKDWGVVWAVRNRMNFWDSSLDGGGNHYWYPGEQTKVLTPRDAAWEEKLGGKEHYLWDHAYRYIMPQETCFAAHPEYYALKGGKRDPSDLCLANTELQRVFAETIIARAKANPDLSSISIEPDDCRGNSCECELCKAMDLPLNTRPNGEGSNRVSMFGNIWPGPLPMTYSVADRWRQYRKYGVKGIMNEGETSWGPQGPAQRYTPNSTMWHNPTAHINRSRIVETSGCGLFRLRPCLALRTETCAREPSCLSTYPPDKVHPRPQDRPRWRECRRWPPSSRRAPSAPGAADRRCAPAASPGQR